MRVSVCIATYNGLPFLPEQMESILRELKGDDEIVIVDDQSTDGTWGYLAGLADARCVLQRNEQNLGVNKTFERAILYSRGEIIVLADQDDRWLPGRVAALSGPIRRGEALLVSSNSQYMDSSGGQIAGLEGRLLARDSSKYVQNIVRVFAGTAPYYGCAMAFHRDLLKYLLPMPPYIESHDLWIAMAANMLRSNCHLEENTLVRRLHGANLSVVSRSLGRKLKSRWIFLRSMLEIFRRIGQGK